MIDKYFLEVIKEKLLSTIDTSVNAKTTPEKELRCFYIDDAMYKQEKIYKGALCTGTRYIKHD